MKLVRIIKTLKKAKIVELSKINIGLDDKMGNSKEHMCVEAIIKADHNAKCELNRMATQWLNIARSMKAADNGEVLFTAIINAVNPTEAETVAIFGENEIEEMASSMPKKFKCWAEEFA